MRCKIEHTEWTITLTNQLWLDDFWAMKKKRLLFWRAAIKGYNNCNQFGKRNCPDFSNSANKFPKMKFGKERSELETDWLTWLKAHSFMQSCEWQEFERNQKLHLLCSAKVLVSVWRRKPIFFRIFLKINPYKASEKIVCPSAITDTIIRSTLLIRDIILNKQGYWISNSFK